MQLKWMSAGIIQYLITIHPPALIIPAEMSKYVKG
jgi:hypothetical protein